MDSLYSSPDSSVPASRLPPGGSGPVASSAAARGSRKRLVSEAVKVTAALVAGAPTRVEAICLFTHLAPIVVVGLFIQVGLSPSLKPSLYVACKIPKHKVYVQFPGCFFLTNVTVAIAQA